MSFRRHRVDNSRIFPSHKDHRHVITNARARFSAAAVRIGILALVAGLFGECVAAAPLPRSSLVAQARSAPSVSDTPAPAPGATIGLPRAKNYEPIPELRDIFFDFGKADIRPPDVKILDANAAWLRAHPLHLVLIEGHSDSRGATDRKNEFNMDLGERRAQAASRYLIAQGIEASRITILSYGQERPRCSEQTERCWSQNRRSRFLVKPR
jgi:outer membrane protein OmpA-like peptidoglycan-associated protein